jgi:hypothetical protein
MAWTDSRIFTQAVLNPLTASAWSTVEPTSYGATGLSTDTINVATYNNSVTPDRDAAVASTGYATGTWSGNEITGTNWAAGGQALGSKTYTANLGAVPFIVSFDAADVSVAAVTLLAFFGDLTYDNTISGGTVAKQGYCFHYYGGTQSVTAGNLTIIWDTTGVFRFSV